MHLLRSKLVCYTLTASLIGLSQPVLGASQDNPVATTQSLEQKQTQAASTTAKDPKPATLKSKDQRQRDRRDDVFKPSEEISEDFAAPLPVDI